MPILYGSLYTNDNTQSKAITHKLDELSSKAIEESLVTAGNPTTGFFIAGGKRKVESAPEQASIIANGRGIFIGRLFNTHDGSSADLNVIDWQAVYASDGASLSSRYWGRYSIALADESMSAIKLFRDPSGNSHLFFTRIPNGIMFASELWMLYDALEVKPELDWHYVTSFISYIVAPTRRTPFEGILELLPGCFVSCNGPTISEQQPFWNPIASTQKLHTDEQKIEKELIDIFKMCTNSWTQGLDGTCLELSGGLDSSSILMMLQAVMPDKKRIGITYGMSSITASYEAPLARSIAAFCDSEFVEIDWSSCPFIVPLQQRLDRPNVASCHHTLYEKLYQVSKANGNLDFMSGHGGDHMFMDPPPVSSITDYWIKKGPRGSMEKIKEISTFYRMPVLQVIKSALSYTAVYLAGHIKDFEYPTKSEPWMTEKFKNYLNVRTFRPPYMEELKEVYPGKVEQIRSIYYATGNLDQGYLTQGKIYMYPYLSQPLVEYALGIPTYMLYKDGNTRYPFRKGMDNWRKNDFVWRRSKGETTGIFMLEFRQALDRVHELLLNGRMMKEGFIEKEALEKSIRQMSAGVTQDFWPILSVLAFELWLETWKLR